jgi:excisionase family DNA binding protein
VSAFLTCAQVADELGVSTRTVLRWIDAGHLAAVRLPGGRLRIPQTALAAMLEAGSTRTADGIVIAADEGGKRA